MNQLLASVKVFMIGIFDSGFGGLTILRRLIDELPVYDTLYLGDNARAPYGSRSQDEIYDFTLQGVEFLFAQGCPLVILACNTASAGALRRIQQEVLPTRWPDRRVLGVIAPTVEQITGTDGNGNGPNFSIWQNSVQTIVVLATEATVRSRAYQLEIQNRAPAIRVIEIACPTLAALIEAGAREADLRIAIRDALGRLSSKKDSNRILPYGKIRFVLLLGCTHFELVKDLIVDEAGPSVSVLGQSGMVSDRLRDYLLRHPEMDARLSSGSTRTFATTGDAASVRALGARFFGSDIHFEHTTLSHVTN